MARSTNITILGIGNILLEDEGFGVHFVNWFEQRHHLPENVQTIDGGTLGMGLLDIVCSCTHLLVIDVLKTDDEPGSLYRFTPEEMLEARPAPTSAHEVAFADVLTKADMLGECPEAVFICIVPESMEERLNVLSPSVAARFEDVECLVLDELRRLHVPIGTSGYA